MQLATNYVILHGESIPYKAWSLFVRNHPSGTVFHAPEMFSLYKRTIHNHPIAISVMENGPLGNVVRGLIVSNIVTNGLGILKPLTARSIIMGGVLVEDVPTKDEIWRLLWAEYRKILPWYVIYTEIRPVFDLSQFDSFYFNEGFERNGHFNLMIDVGMEKERIWEKMHKERRRNITHATSSGLRFCEIEKESEIQQAVNLIRQTYKRKRVPLTDQQLFINAKSELGEHAHWFAVYCEDRMIACQLRLCYGHLVYAWYAASDEDYFKKRPNDYLTWNVLCWAHDQGYKSFDFGGGGEPGKPYGVRDYKLKYGCELYDYGRYQCVHKPILYGIGKIAVKVLNLKK